MCKCLLWQLCVGHLRVRRDSQCPRSVNPQTAATLPFDSGCENQTHPLFRIEPGISCRSAREQASELMGYVRDLTIDGLVEDKPQLLWASHYLCALAKALLDDAELGMTKPLNTSSI
ncbi:DUF3077 domain-containing protein [Pseudomonas plecoglossicida]|uniref:DUF3077 domain-containing protein n=1 Tax=Pseudomonas plecoglossicida TaxID=70775 RepID=UPI003D24A8DA